MGHCVVKFPTESPPESLLESVRINHRYLPEAKAALGDWIVWYEPMRRANRRNSNYFGVSRLRDLTSLPGRPNVLVMHFDQFTPFRCVVPSTPDGTVYEKILNDRNWHSYVQRPVRPLDAAGFEAILAEEEMLSGSQGEPPSGGFVTTGFGHGPQQAFECRMLPDDGSAEPARCQRPRTTITTVLRSVRLRRDALRQYGSACALTPIDLADGQGNHEAECSHWQPVNAGGPDIVQNVTIVTRTIHWCIERGLISLEDNLRIKAKRTLDPKIRATLNPSGFARPPKDLAAWPAPRYLRYHRRRVYGGE